MGEPELSPFAVLNGTQLYPRFWQRGDGDGGGLGPPIPAGPQMGSFKFRVVPRLLPTRTITVLAGRRVVLMQIGTFLGGVGPDHDLRLRLAARLVGIGPVKGSGGTAGKSGNPDLAGIAAESGESVHPVMLVASGISGSGAVLVLVPVP